LLLVAEQLAVCDPGQREALLAVLQLAAGLAARAPHAPAGAVAMPSLPTKSTSA
jgi:hypothetical protein